jgi:hypothetical protein
VQIGTEQRIKGDGDAEEGELKPTSHIEEVQETASGGHCWTVKGGRKRLELT